MTVEQQRPTALYRHFDRSGRLLYVGVSLSAVRRLSQHQKSLWHDDITRVEVEHFKNRESAAKAEAIAIKKEHPLYNKTHRFKPKPEPVTVGSAAPALKFDSSSLIITTTVTKFAKLSGIGKTKVYELLADGKLRGVKIGRNRLIVIESYVDYVRQLETAGRVAAS